MSQRLNVYIRLAIPCSSCAPAVLHPEPEATPAHHLCPCPLLSLVSSRHRGGITPRVLQATSRWTSASSPVQPPDAETKVARHQKLLMKEICRIVFSPAAGCAPQGGVKTATHGGCGLSLSLSLFCDLTHRFIVAKRTTKLSSVSFGGYYPDSAGHDVESSCGCNEILHSLPLQDHRYDWTKT